MRHQFALLWYESDLGVAIEQPLHFQNLEHGVQDFRVGGKLVQGVSQALGEERLLSLGRRNTIQELLEEVLNPFLAMALANDTDCGREGARL